MSKIDFNQIEKDVATLATNLFEEFAKQGIKDGKAFLTETQDDLVSLAQDRAAGAITELEYQNGLREVRVLAKMEAIKQAGLAQVTIDKFTNGIIDIVTKAALAAM
ncbi:MAG: hypothetical protein DME69_07065 [Verrucomicrobia bacterium]|nr:MAG: hypothetical protein DME69_07065 [Verrucomicrobiota bacterium]PYL78113.1 MAG: hypothetical protein DMF26_01715 [Verrucomicrobiota bacterium]